MFLEFDLIMSKFNQFTNVGGVLAEQLSEVGILLSRGFSLWSFSAVEVRGLVGR